jgi:hypothetical protein
VFSNTRAGAFRLASIQARRVRASRAKVRAVQAALVRKERVERRDVQEAFERKERVERRVVQQDVRRGVRKQGALKRRVQKHVQQDVRQAVQQRQRGPQVVAAVLVPKLTQQQRGLVEAAEAVLAHRLMRHRQPTAAVAAEGTRSKNPLAHARASFLR